MLDAISLKKFSDRFQTSELNVAREYCQHLFLSYLYEQPHSEKLCFKGGTALRVVLQSPRFSEDLDFTALYISKHQIEICFINVLERFHQENIPAELEEAKETTGGYLGRARFTLLNREVTIQIELSKRPGKPIHGDAAVIQNVYIPPYTITHLPVSFIIEGKIQALLNRQKPRDFYDYFFLLHGNYPLVKEKDVLQKVLELLKHEKIEFRRELKEFLPKSQAMLLRDFPNILEQKIRSFLG